jgi:hypothetical protein
MDRGESATLVDAHCLAPRLSLRFLVVLPAICGPMRLNMADGQMHGRVRGAAARLLMVLSRRHCSAIALLLRYKYENTIHSFREYCSARVFATAELTMALIEPRDIDLNLLVVFQEVFQERQISSVARRLGLSQPAVSNALARCGAASAMSCSCAPRRACNPRPLPNSWPSRWLRHCSR